MDTPQSLLQGGVVVFVAVFGGLLVYFLPSIIAHLRKHKNEHTITVVNVFAGWTVIGWVILLLWAGMEQ